MRVLLLAHSFNSLTQRLFVELAERGHEVPVELDVNDAVTEEAVGLAAPDVVVAPYLRRAIPENVWRRVPCLVVHPGPPGDRGPAALDRAILEGRSRWGVTVLRAEAEMDAGPVLAARGFAMREASKSSLYRNEVTEAAVDAVLEALADPWVAGERVPGALRPALLPRERGIDWSVDDTATVLSKVRSGDGSPGARAVLGGRPLALFDARPAIGLSGPPGALLARSDAAVALATRDGAAWIGRLRDRTGPHPFKLPATAVLNEAAATLDETVGYEEIRYTERDGVGWLEFDVYNGALSAERCAALRDAFRDATERDTRVIVLAGGHDFWSNGIDLNAIEAAESPADESWRSINAIDDLARAIITTTSHLTIAALAGNAGAGGCFLALGCDLVWARAGVVLNPHYKGMGNLYGSEYWTYLLPRRCGAEHARRITEARLPMGAPEALRLGLLDGAFGRDVASFRAEAARRAAALAANRALPARLADKRARRAADETARPLDDYRADELARMHANFYGFDPSYHIARYNFVHKTPHSRTPSAIAPHRRGGGR